MKKYITVFAIFALLGILAILFRVSSGRLTPDQKTNTQEETLYNLPIMTGEIFTLPEPVKEGQMSLEETLILRRSVRSYTNKPISIRDLSQLLWSAQGITNERGFRTAPSAGATFPLEMFVVVNHVEKLEKGIYHYHPRDHQLSFIRAEDVSEPLFTACLSQSMILDAGIVLVFAAIYERTTARYGERGVRYIYNEVGHASQNVHLQAASLDLGTVVIGAYRDDEVEDILQLGEEYRVLYLMPVGNM